MDREMCPRVFSRKFNSAELLFEAFFDIIGIYKFHIVFKITVILVYLNTVSYTDPLNFQFSYPPSIAPIVLTIRIQNKHHYKNKLY